MNKIPPKLRQEMADDPYYKRCARADIFNDHICRPDPLSGKMIEWEHTLTFKGSQLQKKWAIIPICWLVHRGGMMVKEINVMIALNRATETELNEISVAVDYVALRDRLNKKYADKKDKPILSGIEF